MRDVLLILILLALGSGALAFAIQRLSAPQQEASPASLQAPSSPEDNAQPSVIRDITFSQRSRDGVKERDVQQEYVVISARADMRAERQLTGWRIRSTVSGRSVTIPRAAADVRRHEVTAQEPVTLAAGEQAIIITGASPLGVSFRENICTGYLAQFQQFTPPLAQACPSPRAALAQSEAADDAACAAYVASLPACTTALSPPVELADACRELVREALTYSGCRATHANENGYALPIWRLYLDRKEELWRSSGERLELIDPQGRVVDTFTVEAPDKKQ